MGKGSRANVSIVFSDGSENILPMQLHIERQSYVFMYGIDIFIRVCVCARTRAHAHAERENDKANWAKCKQKW